MDNMLHTLNKFTLRNQQIISKKIKPRRISLSSKRVLRQDRPEKKLEGNSLKKFHILLLAIFIFSFTYFLSSFLPLSFLNSPSIPIQTLNQLNQLALSIDKFIHKDSIDSKKVEQLLTQNYKGVTKLS